MSDFFDSSWLIASIVEDEPHHRLCRKKLEEALGSGSATAAQHSLAEVFHTITGKKRVPPKQAAEILRHNFSEIKWVGLSSEDYWYCVEEAHAAGIRGGAIFDFQILRAADKAKVDRIYTLNKRHFVLFAPHLRNRIEGPD